MAKRQKTFQAKPGQFERKWFVVDAAGKPLGRLASRISILLRGKEKPVFTPHVDTGSFIVVVNASKVKLTGKKLEQKFYYRHSGKPGHLKMISAKDLLRKNPAKLIHFAVRGMLPKNSLSRKMLTKLKVYPDESHPHRAQQPVKIEI